MNRRAVVAVFAVLALAAGGVAWWTLGSDRDEPMEPPTGSPVAACAPEETSPGELPDGYWGMHVASPIGEEFPDAPITAVNLTTSSTYWDRVETAPGRYDFSRIDDIVATADDRGARPMLVLGFTPSFHAKQPDSPNARTTMPDPAAWRAWVTAVVDRFGDSLDYQVWPEPNIMSNWTGTPEQMAQLTAVAGEVIHQQAPDALVVAPATTLRLQAQQKWMDRFWATEVDGVPVSDSVDAVALDPFPLEKGTPEDSLDLVCEAKEILADHDVDLPVWTNEINYGVPSGGHGTDVQHYPDPLQAAVVARTYLLHAAVGVDRTYWLGWFSSPGIAVEMAREGETTPAGEAFSMVHGWLAGGSRPVCRVHEGVHTCVVDGDDARLRIHWREQGTSTVTAVDGASAVETLAGERREVESGDSVSVDQSPIAVVVPSGG